MFRRIPPRYRSVVVFLLAIVVLAGIWFVELNFGGVPTTTTDPFPQWLNKWNLAGFVMLNEGLASPFLDPLMWAVTHTGSTIFLLFASTCLWIAKRRREAVLLAVGVIVGGLIILPVKMIFPTPRPYLIVPGARVLDTEGGGSFPSGHSKNGFTSAAILGAEWKKMKIPLNVLAFLIAISRVYVGVHWPFDVVVGSIVGWIVGKLTVRYDTKIMAILSGLAQSRILHQHVGS
jgi:undecaprenyl-diphosphatase